MKKVMTIIAVGLFLLTPHMIFAKKASESQFTFHANHSIWDTLNQAKLKKTYVTVILRSGKEFKGEVHDLTNASLILGKLSGRDFSDAYILLNEIAAIEAKVRSQ